MCNLSSKQATAHPVHTRSSFYNKLWAHLSINREEAVVAAQERCPNGQRNLS